MGSRMELLELARHLKQERLFITSERQHLQALNEKVLKTVERLFHVAWIAKQQGINLERLILSRPETSPALCCQRANTLEAVTFIDAYKALGTHEPLYGEFLQQFRENPKLVAMCLACGEKLQSQDMMHHLVNVVMASIFGHGILQEDERHVLQLLRHLMHLQLVSSDNPRRLLSHGSCAFSRVYKTFNEGLFSAKLFLTTALHDAIMHLLMEDELFLDIDPGKAAIRFPPQERLRRFGQEGTPEYVSNLQKYRNWTISKLVNLTNRFISGIRSSVYCFPPSLVWLVKQLYNFVMTAKRVQVREVGAMCADLVFSFFICPAIVNPEPFGIISDTPISYIARFNLMQVAQILYVLAMAKWEEIDSKFIDLYGRFDKDCMSSLLDAMLEGGVEDNPPETGSQLPELARSAILISEQDLTTLITFLQNLLMDSTDEDLDKKSLEAILSGLPARTFRGNSPEPNTGQTPSPGSSHTPPSTPSSKRNILGKVSKSRGKTNFLVPGDHGTAEDQRRGELDDPSLITSFVEEVLVISLNNPTFECPGMLSEQKVLSMEQQSRQSKVRVKLENLPTEEENQSITSAGETQEKRTRFSLSHDQDSIGTSDNLEAISEAASNHSVASSLELENENENDNLSDMVSANVSGRGTPNVSGRDTPSSQIEGEEREEQAQPLNLPINAQKQNRDDIDDKFGKFEIRPMMEGDETVSMVSDTWSTDVLASDSEMIEQSEMNLHERPLDDVSIPGHGFLDPQQLLLGLQGPGMSNRGGLCMIGIDMGDTASEAWSTDVLTSDSERLHELDTDDTASVTRSDDTASVARSDDTADVLPEAAGPPTRLAMVSNSTDENITPRASGSRSPIDDPSQAVRMPRLGPTLVLTSGGLCSSNCHALQNAMERLNFQPIKDVEISGEHKMDHQSHSDTARQSASLQHACGKVASLLQKFDQLPSSPEKLADLCRNIRSAAAYSSSDRLESPTEPAPISPTLSDSHFRSLGSGESSSPMEAVTGMQSLGRLSLSIGELPENGILSNDVVFVASSATCTAHVDHDDRTPCEQVSMVESPTPALMNGCMGDDEEMDEEEEDDDEREENGSMNADLSSAGDKEGATDASSPGKSRDLGMFAEAASSSTSREKLADRVRGGGTGVSVVGSAIRLSTSSLTSSMSSNSSSSGGSATGDGIHFGKAGENTSSHSQETTVSQMMPSAGVIPKSISFDKTAEKGDRDTIDSSDHKHKKGFFKNFKIPFKGRTTRKPSRSHEELGVPVRNYDRGFANELVIPAKDDGQSSSSAYARNLRRTVSEDPKMGRSQETGDDILDKYRKKPVSMIETDVPTNGIDGLVDGQSMDKIKDKELMASGNASIAVDEDRQAVDPSNPEASFAFSDAKRKLRLVLSSADVATLPFGGGLTGFGSSGGRGSGDLELVSFLKMQSAEAINLQDRNLDAQLHETLRCVQLFDKDGCKKLFRSLRDDYKKRAPYIAYLVRCRQGLLTTLAHLERVLNRIERHKVVCNKFMISVCVRLFLEQSERITHRFVDEFQRLTVSDEKTDLVEKFLQRLYRDMERDPIWQAASMEQTQQAQVSMERSIMSQIYIPALYPNGDGDVMRDKVIFNHIQKLAKVITPNHKYLRIPKIYQYECPWPAAQAEIATINAYKTPQDKLQCVLRCCSTIMNLLRLANEKSIPAADEFMPVLVYVMVKANPGNLLSTIQYVNSFYHQRIQGEDEYWWTQFCSAVEFIKTMDYDD